MKKFDCGCKQRREKMVKVFNETLTTVKDMLGMNIRDKIILESQSWLNTPYIHKQRVKGVGVDCVQLIIGIALELDLIKLSDIADLPIYSIQEYLHDDSNKLLDILEQYKCKKVKNLRPGDILVFQYGRSASHVAVLLPDNMIIHARLDLPVPRVVINTYSDEYKERFVRAYSFPGV